MRENRETATTVTAAAAPAGTADGTAAALPADAVTGAVPAQAATAYAGAAAVPAGAEPGDGIRTEQAAQAEQEEQAEQDPAGGITLSGRSRAGLRARVLTGVMVTAGLVAAASGPDTVSSFRIAQVW